VKMDDHQPMVNQKGISEKTGPTCAKSVPELMYH
jgi:hypothetical protein